MFALNKLISLPVCKQAHNTSAVRHPGCPSTIILAPTTLTNGIIATALTADITYWYACGCGCGTPVDICTAAHTWQRGQCVCTLAPCTHLHVWGPWRLRQCVCSCIHVGGPWPRHVRRAALPAPDKPALLLQELTVVIGAQSPSICFPPGWRGHLVSHHLPDQLPGKCVSLTGCHSLLTGCRGICPSE